MRDLVEAQGPRRWPRRWSGPARRSVGHPDPATAVAVGAHVVRGALLQEAIHGPGLLPLDDDALVDELTDLFTSYLRIPRS